MRKALLIAVLLNSCLAAIGQKLPKDAIPLIKEEYVSYLHQNFKHYAEPGSDYKNAYKVGDILLSFYDAKSPAYKTPYTKIKTINNIRFLVTEKRKDDEVELRFTSGKMINGMMQYKKADETEAQVLLSELF